MNQILELSDKDFKPTIILKTMLLQAITNFLETIKKIENTSKEMFLKVVIINLKNVINKNWMGSIVEFKWQRIEFET